jgi:DNA polymerase I-like protein with 3'-5' exonuclease and polymerase domains
MTFAQIASISVDQVTDEQRKIGKTLRHSTNYSAGPQVLANRLGIKLGEARQLIELYHRANPQLKTWYATIEKELKSTRMLYNLSGRKHKFLDRWGDSLFRSAYSYIPQSTVGDLLNKALLRLYDAQLELDFDMTILLQLHDAVYTMVEEKYVDFTIKLMRKCMMIPLKYNNEEFTIDVDFKVGDSWGEGKELDINWRNVA